MRKSDKYLLGVLVLALLSGTAGKVFSQQKGDYSRVGDQVERLLDGMDSESTPDERLIERLVDLAENPVPVNSASRAELLNIPWLDIRKARSIIAYRESNGPFETEEELLNVKNFNSRDLSRIKPYITVEPPPSTKSSIFREFNSRSGIDLIMRFQRTIQQRDGFVRPDSAGGYPGRPFKLYQRIRIKGGRFTGNITQETDPGEPMEHPWAFDYRSGYVAYHNGSDMDFVIGDYSPAFGQGLLFWNGSAFGKGREVVGTGVNRKEGGIKPYASAVETGYLRGVAATYGNKISVTGFFSRRSRDATIVHTDSVRFPGGTGLHRTPTEREKVNAVRESVIGGRVRFAFSDGTIGATYHKTDYDKVIARGTGLHNRYDLAGTGTTGLGIDYKWLFGPFILFGEAAGSMGKGTAVISGLEFKVENTELIFLYRNYAKDFHSVFGRAFGEQTGLPQNEEGLYAGVSYQINDQLSFKTYVDQYRFNAPRFGTRQPTKGIDWLGVLEGDFDNGISMYLQGRSESKEDEYASADRFGRSVRRLGIDLRTSVRAHFEYRVNRTIRLRFRGEWVKARNAGEDYRYGYLFYQDVRVTPSDKWKIDVRLTVFGTDDFTSRVFQFENDLLYVFTVPALFDEGQKMYLLLNYEPFPFLEIWLKAATTVYEDRQVIGSGLDRIQGRRKSDVGIQVRIQF